jgi:hypothetical protein
MPRCARPAFVPQPGVVPLAAALIAALALSGAGCRDSSAGGGTSDGGRGGDAAGDQSTSAVDADCPTDGPGGGVCPINFCGYVKSTATLGQAETLQNGADSLCNQGRICLATVVAATGDALALSCLVPRADGLGYGATCSKDPASGLRCKDDSLCVEAADAPGAFFCTTLCRLDADCAMDSICLQYQQALPNQLHALVGECTPKSKIAQAGCTAERDCPAGQGCVPADDLTAFLVCKVGGPKSLGESCAAPADCRSGACYDRDFRVGNGATRAFCSGVCSRNSDCGVDQRCVAEVRSNNGTDTDPLDDVVLGYCRSLFTATVSGACENDAACVARGLGGDTCDPTYGICYKSAAVIGGPCSHDDGCGLGGVCDLGPTFVGGACVLDGCTVTLAGVAAAGVDLCPGARSICSQRQSDEPLHRCYEGCSTSTGCSRAAENYFCAAPQDGPGQPISICISRTP